MLQDIRTKREQALARVDPSCGYAMEFYKNNRDKFEQEIFFPPFVSLEVKDKAYASIVEACIPNDLMKVSLLYQSFFSPLTRDFADRPSCAKRGAIMSS